LQTAAESGSDSFSGSNKSADHFVLFFCTSEAVTHITGPFLLPVYRRQISDFSAYSRLFYVSIDAPLTPATPSQPEKINGQCCDVMA
jgi:hypothetical protein